MRGYEPELDYGWENYVLRIKLLINLHVMSEIRWNFKYSNEKCAVRFRSASNSYGYIFCQGPIADHPGLIINLLEAQPISVIFIRLRGGIPELCFLSFFLHCVLPALT
jgi:hypothetical protein